VLCQAAQGTRFCVVDPGCVQEMEGKPKKSLPNTMQHYVTKWCDGTQEL